MAYTQRDSATTMKAAVAIPQHRIVEMTANPFEVSLAGAGQGFGVCQNLPLAGEAATIVDEGHARVQAGGAVAVGNFITAAASGYGVAVGSAGVTGKVIGRAMTAAASGSNFTVDLGQRRIQTA